MRFLYFWVGGIDHESAGERELKNYVSFYLYQQQLLSLFNILLM